MTATGGAIIHDPEETTATETPTAAPPGISLAIYISQVSPHGEQLLPVHIWISTRMMCGNIGTYIVLRLCDSRDVVQYDGQKTIYDGEEDPVWADNALV